MLEDCFKAFTMKTDIVSLQEERGDAVFLNYIWLHTSIFPQTPAVNISNTSICQWFVGLLKLGQSQETITVHLGLEGFGC